MEVSGTSRTWPSRDRCHVGPNPAAESVRSPAVGNTVIVCGVVVQTGFEGSW